MSEQLAKLDEFEEALKRLRAMQDKMPDSFEFDVPTGYFSGLNFGEAIPRQRMMREFERFCHVAGYRIDHSHVKIVPPGRPSWDVQSFWRYSLKRNAKALPPPKPKEETAIDV